MQHISVVFLIISAIFAAEEGETEEYVGDICELPWQTHEMNNLATYSQCSEFQDDGVKCTPNDPIECTGRNPVCVFSKMTEDYRCCSDIPQDLGNPPPKPDQIKPICPYGASSYDIPSVLLCDPEEPNSCPEEYTCEQAINYKMTAAQQAHLCCKTSTLESFENVFYETKVGINKMSGNLSMPLFYVTSISPSIIPHAPLRGIDFVVLHDHTQTSGSIPPEIRTGDHFSMLPYRFRKPVYLRKVVLLHDQMLHEFHHVLVLYNPHGNPEAMHFYYNRPTTLSREIDLSVPAWDEGIFFRNMNRVLTIQSDQTSTKQVRKLYIVLVFQTKVRITRRNQQTWHDFTANYTSFTEFLYSETGKFFADPVAGSYFYRSIFRVVCLKTTNFSKSSSRSCTESSDIINFDNELCIADHKLAAQNQKETGDLLNMMSEHYLFASIDICT